MAKQELEFLDPNSLTWRRPEGYPEGILELIITEDKETSEFTRLLKFEPGTVMTNVLVHECWEEVYILEGGLICGDQVYTTGMVTVRPPGMKHGPFKTPVGALTFEVHYRRSKD
jgi:anti-sigma factor ChrR (cupin superfamily)